MINSQKEKGGSFRDPSGNIFFQSGEVYRKINLYYKDNYDFLLSSGLYKKLSQAGFLIPHKEERPNKFEKNKEIYKIIKPVKIPFVSYPFEWCFSQIKDAALLTLKINKIALEYGMILKDASNYNIQFYEGRPVFIDTLSFEKYQKGQIWNGYRQFCKHFLAPLLLAGYKDFRLSQLLRTNIDGISLDLLRKLLPKKAFTNPKIFAHILVQSKTEDVFSKAGKPKRKLEIKKDSLLALNRSLEGLIESIEIKRKKSEWGEYYQDNNYTKNALQDKYEKVERFLKRSRARFGVWDLGANDGYFSRIASSKNIYTISIDNDENAVEANYRKAKTKKEKFLLPLYIDLTNPTPPLGWANEERDSLIERGPGDCIFALALIHHLSIGNNLPFEKIAKFFSLIGNSLIIEFIPKSDSQVQKLLSFREDVFANYTQKYFEKSFSDYFRIVTSEKISGSERSLYLMQKK